MILQQLERDADRLVGGLPPSMYAPKPVKWIVELDADGGFLGFQATSGGGKKDKGLERPVPFKNRTVAIQPLLLADKPTYTWGVPIEHKRAHAEHGAYMDLLDRCAAETGNADVAAVARFLRSWTPEALPLPAEIQPDELTTFRVDGRFPVDDPPVQRFWARAAGGEEGAGIPGQCLVCGQRTRVVERLPVAIKGLPNGQSSGVALVSANATAFESYGRTVALISPICLPCGERFGKAAQALLRDDHKHLNVGPVAYLFWAPEADWDPADFLRNPDPLEVRELLNAARSGRPPTPGDDTSFYAVALSAAISRAVIRSWLHTTVGAARSNLARWFRLQRLVQRDGSEWRPLSVFRLAVSAYREARDIVGRAPEALLEVALHGGPLPEWLLHQAVLRNRAVQAVTYPRAALIKAVLCSTNEEEAERMEQLDLANRQPAYLCGRLLAELEAIQRVAINPRATLVDRFYGTASSAPASVFGTLLRGAQPHLSVLRKTRPGAHARLQERLEEIMRDLKTWPAVLTLRDQAVFALGYYHQRAEDRRAAQEARAKRLSAEEAPLELGEESTAEKEETR